MWALAVTNGAAEFQVRDRLRAEALNVFLPYSREKQITSVMPPRTTSTPRPRVRHAVAWKNVARWPGYLFAEVLSDVDLNTVRGVRGVLTLVRGAEGMPALLTDSAMVAIRSGCAEDGRVLKTSELHGFSVGDMLRFVTKSNFASRDALVQSIDENGMVRVLVEGRLKATVHYSELTSAIG